MDLEKTYLILEDGTQFEGYSPKSQTKTVDGETVFNTGMTGYVESLTDPSYHGQILTFTYPILGNYGVPEKKYWESFKIHVKGVIFASICSHWNHHKSSQSLFKWLQEHDIPWISSIDTRALTKKIRINGTMFSRLTKKPNTLPKKTNIQQKNILKEVSIQQKQTYSNGKKQLIVVDCGIKENILRCLKKFSWTIHHVPYNYNYLNHHYDAIFISNGPGDPKECLETIAILKQALEKKKPIFGICLGSQLLGLAAGAKTYKLLFGHRSHNQPCIDLESEKCYITSQNHGYAIDEKTVPDQWKVTFKNLNDQSVEGIAHKEFPFHGVQFHPEGSPGPTDTVFLFEQFYNRVGKNND